jgi:hypothetical protein
VYFEYLDLPAIPVALIEADSTGIELRENIFRNPEYKFYKQYRVSEDITDFLKTIFTYNFHASYQVIRSGISIHKDGGRTNAINYILSQGGDNASLNIYDDDKRSILHREIIKKHKWHQIDVSKFHNVTNITGVRMSVTVVKIHDIR